MKRLIVVLVSMLVLSSCGDNAEETLIVTGKVKGLKKGMLYLQHVPDSVLVTVDSLAINGDGNFTFKSKLESPEIYYLYLKKKDNNDINDRITFFAEPIEIMMKASQPENQLSQVSIDSLENISNRNLQRGYAFAINFALNNKNSFVAPYIALKEIPDANVKYLDSIYSVLSPEVANSKYGEELALLLKKK